VNARPASCLDLELLHGADTHTLQHCSSNVPFTREPCDSYDSYADPPCIIPPPWCKQPIECWNKIYPTRILHSFSQCFNFSCCLDDFKAVPQPLNCCTSNCNGALKSIISGCVRAELLSNCAKKTMGGLGNLFPSVEEDEGNGSVCAFRFTLLAQLPKHCSMLIS
jgi:hypothetical protein